MSAKQYYVGLDVGGTTMKAAVVDDKGKPFPSVSTATEPHKGQEVGLEKMCETIRQAVAAAQLQMSDIVAIGVATPGPMDIRAGLILDPANLKPWKNVPVREHIQKVFQLPTAYQNDANAAALGEYWVGSGHDVKSMVLFTLGTGIGGGIIMDDKILEGEHSHGGEIGHMTIEMTNGRLCGCGRKGCLEAYGSATNVVRRTQEALDKDSAKKSMLHDMITKADGKLTAKLIFDAAFTGDALAYEVFDRTAYYLAVGAANMMHIINPELIVYGGGMVGSGEPFLSRIQSYIRETALPVPAEKTKVRFATLGSDAGFIGTAACARLLVNNGKLY